MDHFPPILVSTPPLGGSGSKKATQSPGVGHDSSNGTVHKALPTHSNRQNPQQNSAKGSTALSGARSTAPGPPRRARPGAAGSGTPRRPAGNTGGREGRATPAGCPAEPDRWGRPLSATVGPRPPRRARPRSAPTGGKHREGEYGKRGVCCALSSDGPTSTDTTQTFTL